MNWHITLSCEGHRHGQPCRGALHTKARDQRYAAREALNAGWTFGSPSHRTLCPSPNHDEKR